MFWAGILIAALVTVPVSVIDHNSNTSQTQAAQETAEFASMEQKTEYANAWCDPTQDL